MIPENAFIVLSVVKSMIISFAVHGICEKKGTSRFSVIAYFFIISTVFLYVNDFEISCFLVSFFTLIYSRLFLKGNVIMHEVIMACVYGILFLSRVVPLILTRLITGNSLYSPIMVGNTGLIVYLTQFNLGILLFWLCWYIGKKQYREWKFEGYYVLCIEILRGILYFIANKNSNEMKETDYFGQIIAVAFEIFIVIAYGLVYYMQRTNKIKLQNIMLWNKCENEQEKIVMWQQDYFEARKLRHDIKNIHNMYYAMLESGDVNEVMNLLKEDQLNDERLYSFSENNRMINAILNDFTIKCRNHEIVLKIVLNDLHLEMLEKDIAIILMNLLENAFEAADKSKEKVIKLDIFFHNKMYNIICKNSIDNPVLLKNPNLYTNKSDKDMHGLGVQIIRKKVDEYGGIIDFSEGEGVFVAHVMIPC